MSKLVILLIFNPKKKELMLLFFAFGFFFSFRGTLFAEAVKRQIMTKQLKTGVVTNRFFQVIQIRKLQITDCATLNAPGMVVIGLNVVIPLCRTAYTPKLYLSALRKLLQIAIDRRSADRRVSTRNMLINLIGRRMVL